MSRRTQITLTDDQYRALKRESDRTGVSLSELIRRAVARVYGIPKRKTRSGFEESFGIWADRDFDGESYVEAMRRGLGRRLGE